MTILVERVTMTVTLIHDEVASTAYGHRDGVNLREVIQAVWPRLCPWPGLTEGRLRLPGIDITWKATGIEEEVGEGDN